MFRNDFDDDFAMDDSSDFDPFGLEAANRQQQQQQHQQQHANQNQQSNPFHNHPASTMDVSSLTYPESHFMDASSLGWGTYHAPDEHPQPHQQSTHQSAHPPQQQFHNTNNTTMNFARWEDASIGMSTGFGGGGGATRDSDTLSFSTSFPSSSPSSDHLFPSDPQAHRVSLTLQERLSISFDPVSNTPSCRVVGTIQLDKPPKPPLGAFSLTIVDPKHHLERWEGLRGVCQGVASLVQPPPPVTTTTENGEASQQPPPPPPPNRLDFRVTLPPSTHALHPSLESPILGYSCGPKLKPIPLLLKTKIQSISHPATTSTTTNPPTCRVGIRVRANPGNPHRLTHLILILIVPPDIPWDAATTAQNTNSNPSTQSQTVPTEARWDDMQRTLSWTLDSLPPGDVMDVQALFVTHVPADQLQFPVLVRCDGDTLFSKVQLEATTPMIGGGMGKVDLAIQTKTRVLYRKV
eukprot:Nitzschia sp. Nitz4//scaffold391_size11912//4640//6216//NITZ4_009007-RA/size11912-augustus-gene-0.1-mRNA-1//1//CDS//3329550200//5407//frame0